MRIAQAVGITASGFLAGTSETQRAPRLNLLPFIDMNRSPRLHALFRHSARHP
jgi:hypothetical protein